MDSSQVVCKACHIAAAEHTRHKPDNADTEKMARRVPVEIPIEQELASQIPVEVQFQQELASQIPAEVQFQQELASQIPAEVQFQQELASVQLAVSRETI
jgi:hypothetical protein